ncbi:MAG: hypothetical protein WCT26_04130 [Candidatus Buchananbacteria bacterium]|jgi:hypothetical protein
MPYIKQKDREPLDPLIDELAESIVERIRISGEETAFAGLLNYTFTRLLLKVIKLQFGKMRYWIIDAATGAFKNASDEFYRRIGVPYENAQIRKNGDVNLYEEFQEIMELQDKK